MKWVKKRAKWVLKGSEVVTENREYPVLSLGYRHIKSSNAVKLPVQRLLATASPSNLSLFGPGRNRSSHLLLMLGYAGWLFIRWAPCNWCWCSLVHSQVHHALSWCVPIFVSISKLVEILAGISHCSHGQFSAERGLVTFMSFILYLRCSISCQTRPTAKHSGSEQNLNQVMDMS